MKHTNSLEQQKKLTIKKGLSLGKETISNFNNAMISNNRGRNYVQLLAVDTTTTVNCFPSPTI